MMKENIQPDDETTTPQHLKGTFGRYLAPVHRRKRFRKSMFLYVDSVRTYFGIGRFFLLQYEEEKSHPLYWESYLKVCSLVLKCSLNLPSVNL